MPIHSLPLNTYLDKPKWKEMLCLALGAGVKGLAPVCNECRKHAGIQVPVIIRIVLSLKKKKMKLGENFGVGILKVFLLSHPCPEVVAFRALRLMASGISKLGTSGSF